MIKYFVTRNFRRTYSSVEILKGYVLICWNAEGIHGQEALFYTHSPYFMCHCHCTECKLSALLVRISEKNTLNAATAVHNCKNIRLRVKTGE